MIQCALFYASRTGATPYSGVFSIAPAPDVENADVIYLATLLSSTMGKAGLATIGSSVKSAATKNMGLIPLTQAYKVEA